MTKMSTETRLYLALIGVNLDFLALFFFIISLLRFYGESPYFPILEISFFLIGTLLIFIGLIGYKRNREKVQNIELKQEKTIS